MAEVGEHWTRLATAYRQSTARSLAVSAPTGAGVGRLVEGTIVEAVAAEQAVVLVAPMLVLLEQWRHRLESQAVPVVTLQGGSAWLLALDAGPAVLRGGPGVLLISAALFVAKGHLPPISEHVPDLLVLDHLQAQPDSRTALSLRPIMQRAGRVVQLLDPLGAAPLEPFDEQLTLTLAELVEERNAGITLRSRTIAAAPDGGLRRKALDLLGSEGAEALASASDADLHAELARMAARAEEDPQRSPGDTYLRQVNDMLERLEASEEVDPAVAALVVEVEAAQRAGRPCLVSVRTIVESEYLASVLREAGLDAQSASRAREGIEQADILRALSDGRTVVRTRFAHQGWTLPPNTTYIWWSPPSPTALAQELAQAVSSRNVELVAFHEETARTILELLGGARGKLAPST